MCGMCHRKPCILGTVRSTSTTLHGQNSCFPSWNSKKESKRQLFCLHFHTHRTRIGIRLPYTRQRELSHRRQRCQNGRKVLCLPYTRQRKRLVATSAPKGFGTLRFLNPFESLPSLSIRYAMHPPQGWESKNAAVRRERASGNDTEQCPVHGNVGTPQRGSVQP